MSSLLMVGSLAYDTVETPTDKAENALGGSAVYSAAAAGLFCPVNLVGVVGTDFDMSQLDFLKERRVDLSGVEVAKGETFRWSGIYGENFQERTTLSTDLNVFADFQPKLPENYKDDKMVFLANINPVLQADVLEQVKAAKFVALDTMNLWIDIALDALKNVFSKCDMVVLNDEEAEQLSGTRSIMAAARAIGEMGPRVVVIKKGEHGAFVMADGQPFSIPALPLEKVVDPTGAGDSFAGGMMGYLTAAGDTSPASIRKAIVYGTAAASLTVEAFSVDGLKEASRKDVDSRYNDVYKLTHFESINH